jgi:hypothetical protein
VVVHQFEALSGFMGLENFLNPGTAAICTGALASVSVILNVYGGVLKEDKRVLLQRQVCTVT